MNANLTQTSDLIDKALARLKTKLKDTPHQENYRDERMGELLLSSANLSKRHRAFSFNREGRWGEVFDGFKLKLERTGLSQNGFLAALVGTRWSGKTQMAHALIQVQCETMLKSAYYCKTLSVFIKFKDAYKADGSESSVVSFFRKPEFLVLDDSHERSESQWENRMLTHIVDLRYDDMKSTLLISNLNPDEFTEAIGPSIARRLNEAGGIICADWPTFEPKP